VYVKGAAVRLKREEFGLAIYDAGKALELDPKYVKAHYRRAVANLSVLKPKAALIDFKQVVALDPKNASAKAQLDSTIKLVRKQDFEKAIASKDDEAISVRIKKHLQDEALEPSYDGPKLEEYVDAKGKKRARPTKEFVEGMIQHFKAEKLLPKRYVWWIVLGCQEELLKHESLVEVTIPEGQTCDVIGDTHG
jgi:serine/threonine-protein phosphatase 5